MLCWCWEAGAELKLLVIAGACDWSCGVCWGLQVSEAGGAAASVL